MWGFFCEMIWLLVCVRLMSLGVICVFDDIEKNILIVGVSKVFGVCCMIIVSWFECRWISDFIG